MDFLFLDINNLLTGTWHWAFGGVAIAISAILMNFAGKRFGISSAFEVACTIAGAGKKFKFFQREINLEYWRIAFVIGVIFGGFLCSQFFMPDQLMDLNPNTVFLLDQYGMGAPSNMNTANGIFPTDLFNLSNPFGIILGLIGGFLVGFGARYAKGCTSGHAITGISHLQITSLVTVIGFFIGGLVMTWIIFPLIFA